MLILAFDTSGFSGSVALLDGSRLLAESTLDAERRSAQTLAPAIVRLLEAQHVAPGQIQLVAATVGPGSFTGLRVGVTTAKTLAYVVGAAVLAISTLESIAHGVPGGLLAGKPREVQAVLDAQRGDLFVGRFASAPAADWLEGLSPLTRVEPDRIVPAAEWLAGLPGDAVVTGAGLKRLESQLPAGVIVVPPELRQANAAVVGRLAWRDYNAGRRDDLWKLAPVYLRPSYAEEKEKTAGTKPGPGAS